MVVCSARASIEASLAAERVGLAVKAASARAPRSCARMPGLGRCGCGRCECGDRRGDRCHGRRRRRRCSDGGSREQSELNVDRQCRFNRGDATYGRRQRRGHPVKFVLASDVREVVHVSLHACRKDRVLQPADLLLRQDVLRGRE